MNWLMLYAAIAFEVVGTTSLKLSQGLTRPGWFALCLALYGTSFALLAMSLKVIPVGVAYAIWSGLGIILIALIGLVWFGQKLDTAALVGLGLIVAGVAVINLFSNTVVH